MATITPFSSRRILSWRLRIGILLLAFAVSQQPRTGRLVFIADAFGGPTTQRMMRPSVTSSRRNLAFLDSRRRLWSLPSSPPLKSKNSAKGTQHGLLALHQSHEPFTLSKRRTKPWLFRSRPTVGTSHSRFFSASNASPLQVISSPVEEESTSNSTTTGAEKPMFFAQQASAIRIEGDETTTIQSNDDDLLEGLASRPVKGGNWDPSASLVWANDFGRRCPEYDEKCMADDSFTKLRPGDEGYFDVSEIDASIANATIVRTKEQAKIVMEKLMNADPSIFHACDTEVMDIKLKEVGPVGNGYVTCLSVYSGPDFDYGLGVEKGSTLWIDNLDDAHGILQEFKPWMEDERFKKIWHNYGFDRHVMWNEGILCKGFGGDTMHMARLQDTSRMKNGGGYSLEALTDELLGMRKRPMKEIFGVPRIRKDGTPGSILDIPPIDVLQRDPKFRKNFIDYSCYDAVGTWNLHQKLVELLKKLPWISEDTNLYDYYWTNMREFGEVLTDMERRGVRVDAKDYLASVEVQARQDRKDHLRKFREWAATEIGPDGLAINPASSVQLCTLLFGGSQNIKTREYTEAVRMFKVPREEIPDVAMEAYKKRDEQQQANTSDQGA